MAPFSMPSLPYGVFHLIDTSPPVFYPAPRHRSRSRSVSITAADSPRKGLGNLLPASASSNDLSGEWEPIVRVTPSRRSSVCSLSENDCVPLPDISPARPRHRRTQSVMPPGVVQPRPASFACPASLGGYGAPLGRLQEYSRNPASTSAVSLPTLAELEAHDGRSSVPVSPMFRGRNRPSSRASMISLVEPSSPTSPIAELPEEEDFRGRRPFASSVPPPQNSMPPPALPSRAGLSSNRPPTSPRSWSAQDVSLHRRASLNHRARRPSTESISSLSDVQVMATWAFPTSPDRETPERSTRPAQRGAAAFPLPNHQSLKERLQALSSLDTSSLPTPSFPTTPAATRSLASAAEARPAPQQSPSTFQPVRSQPLSARIVHRHTHSSPNVLLVTGPISASGPVLNAINLQLPHCLLPPPRPVRRTTTSRLRNPNPLSLPVEQPPAALSSSPGSMTSDDSSIRSTSPTARVIDDDPPRRRPWWKGGPSMTSPRRRSMEAVATKKTVGETDGSAPSGFSLQSGLETRFERISDCGEEGEEGIVVAVEVEEDFIDMEGI